MAARFPLVAAVAAARTSPGGVFALVTAGMAAGTSPGGVLVLDEVEA